MGDRKDGVIEEVWSSCLSGSYLGICESRVAFCMVSHFLEHRRVGEFLQEARSEVKVQCCLYVS